MKVEFCGQIFEKYSNNKFHENLSTGSRVVPCGLTDRRKERYDEVNRRFSRFCERAKKLASSVISRYRFQRVTVWQKCFRLLRMVRQRKKPPSVLA